MSKLRTAAEIAMARKASTRFGYNSVVSTDRRRPVKTRPTTEDFELPARKREIGTSTTRDDRRNMSLLAWMVRRHLDNVSRFTPHFRVPGDSQEARDLTAVVKRMLAWHGRKRQFDALGRHGRDEWLRMFEATKVLTGDCGGLKVKGWKMQGISGERIAYKAGGNTTEGVSQCGIKFNADGTRNAFSVCKYNADGNGMDFDRMVPVGDMIFDGYWPETFDSDRGVSPLLTALNECADVRETWEWLVLKAKASAVFGLAFTRKSSDPMGATLTDDPATAPNTEATSYAQQVAAGIKARGLINLDLDEGDDVKEVQSSTPNPQVIVFTRELIRSVLLALDIPFTFYDSLTASFSARIADRNEYEEACEWKREKNMDVLDEIYGGWLLPLWEQADLFGFGKALRAAKMTTEEVSALLRWVPAGRPWLDRTNEMSGHILALTAGVTSTPRICSSYGEDAYEIAEEQSDYLKRAGAPLLYANGGQQAVQAIMSTMGQQQQPAEKPQPHGGQDDAE